MEDDGYILSARSGLATPSVGEIFALALALAAYARIEGPTLVGRARGPGLRLLGDVPWGRHVALFYERKEDLLELCVPFLKAGLESTEVCVWVIAEPLTERDAWAALGAAVSPRDLDRYRADRPIEMLQSQTWYFTRDSPDLQTVRLPDHRASRSRRHAYASVDHQEAPRGIGSAIGENGR